MNREQRDGGGGGRLLAGLADRQLGVDDLVEVADEITDAGQRELTLEPRRELEDLAQVQQRARAAVALRSELRPAQVARLLEQAIQDVGHGEGVPQSAEAIRKVDESGAARRHFGLHIRKALEPRRFE